MKLSDRLQRAGALCVNMWQTMTQRPRSVQPDTLDPEMLPLVVLMTIGSTPLGRWDDVRLARELDVRPSEARRVLEDLADWGMIEPIAGDAYAITYRGTRNMRVYLPGGYIPRA